MLDMKTTDFFNLSKKVFGISWYQNFEVLSEKPDGDGTADPGNDGPDDPIIVKPPKK